MTRAINERKLKLNLASKSSNFLLSGLFLQLLETPAIRTKYSLANPLRRIANSCLITCTAY
jgi:hypothetical protein